MIYNILGQKVANLTDKAYEPGAHSITFNDGNLSGGMYIIRALITSKKVPNNRCVFLKKMMVIK